MRVMHIGIFLSMWVGFSLFFGEKIPAANGLGWDGVTYANITQNLFYLIKEDLLNVYIIQRIFPSFLIFSGSKIFNYSLSPQNIPFLFSLLNATMLFICFMILNSMGKVLQWSKQVKIISFAALFFNFANLKMAFYYPTLTDTTALTIGLCMAYCYLTERNIFLYVLSIIGAWTFPTLFCMGMILFLFPINRHKSSNVNFKQYNPWIGFIAAASLTSTFVFAVHNNIGQATLGKNHFWPIFYLSVFFLLIFLFSAFKYLTPYRLNFFTKALTLQKLLITIFTLILVPWLIKYLGGGHQGALNLTGLYGYISHGALAYPFNFLSSHTFYYGGAVVLFILFWKDIADYIFQKGPGLFVLVIMGSILFVGSESRQISNFFPFLVVGAAEVLNKRKVSWNFAYFFVFINLLLSRFWLPLNHGSWPDLNVVHPNFTLEFPLQWYFMNHGPWVSPSMYWILATFSACLFLCMYAALKKEKVLNSL